MQQQGKPKKQQNQLTPEQQEELERKKKMMEEHDQRVLSVEEFVSKIVISPVEKTAINTVFERLCSAKEFYKDDSNQQQQQQQQESQQNQDEEKKNGNQNQQKNGLSISGKSQSQMGGRNSKKGQRQQQSEMQTKSKLKSQYLYSDEKHFTANDLKLALNQLEYFPSNDTIREMIWDIDESNTGRVNKDAFILMYKRCRYDKTGMEPRNLYNIVQYMMYLYHSSANSSNQQEQDNNKNEKRTKITVENTLEILYVIFGREGMERMTEIIFGDGSGQIMIQNHQDAQVGLEQYLKTMKKQDQLRRQQIKNDIVKSYEDPSSDYKK